MFRGGFFCRGFRADLGGSEAELAGAGASRRELYELINSRAFAESPNISFRCSAAASFGRVDV